MHVTADLIDNANGWVRLITKIRAPTNFGRAQWDRVLGRVLARWHEGGVGELGQDRVAVARRVRIELPIMFVGR